VADALLFLCEQSRYKRDKKEEKGTFFRKQGPSQPRRERFFSPGEKGPSTSEEISFGVKRDKTQKEEKRV